jgi:hypothetical protein
MGRKELMARILKTSGPLLIIGILGVPAIAGADTIQIMSGAAVSRSGQLSVVDVAIASPDHGFSLAASGSAFGGEYDLYNLCRLSPACMPGNVVSLDAAWSGSDFAGTARADGLTFPLNSGGTETSGDAAVFFMGSWTVPAYTGTTTTTAIAPFTFTGFVDYPYDARPGAPNPFPRRRDNLIGSGLTTINLAWEPGNASVGAWTLTGVRYEFVPTPEPGTLLLVAPLALGLVRRYSMTHRARS